MRGRLRCAKYASNFDCRQRYRVRELSMDTLHPLQICAAFAIVACHLVMITPA